MTTEPGPGRLAVSALLFLLVLGWASAPFFLLYGMAVGTPFFGELPSEENRKWSRDLTTVALVSFVGFPAVGAALAALVGRRRTAVQFGVMLVLGIALTAVCGMLSPHALADRWDSFFSLVSRTP